MEQGFVEKVAERIKWCQERKEPTLVWVTEVGKCVGNWGLSLPSPELGEVLVSLLCFRYNSPPFWKLLDQALSTSLLSPTHLLSLLTSRVIPHRQSQPQAFRLYLELLNRYDVLSDLHVVHACKERVVESIDIALGLSQTFGLHNLGIGHVLVLAFFSIVNGLIDSTSEDWGWPLNSVSKGSEAVRHLEYIDIASEEEQTFLRDGHQQLLRSNSYMAIEVLGKLTEGRKAVVALHVVQSIFPEKFVELSQKLHFLEAHSSTSDSNNGHHLVLRLTANIQRALGFGYQLSKCQLNEFLIGFGSHKSAFSSNIEAWPSGCWVSFDIYMENVMDGQQLPVRSAIDILRETINTLQVFNKASWEETFLSLWLSALQLVQRERNPLEGPVPHLEARLCVLLSVVPLAIAQVCEDEAKLRAFSDGGIMDGRGHGIRNHTTRREGLISSLQVLGQFAGLLCPPASVVDAANSAANKAANFIANSKNFEDSLSQKSSRRATVKADGNMRHLIVEACITRNLIDTSVYFWPDYVSPVVTSVGESAKDESWPWTAFMEGAPLTSTLTNALIATPASRIAEIEKLYHIALNGSEDERSAAARILCGASLCRGWNIQEHVVQFVVKLLSPPAPLDFVGPESHLVKFISMLSAILFGASSIDAVHILSLHGLVPEVAASLVPLCEVFGSLEPISSNQSNRGDQSSIYMVFSAAFLVLLRLWKFYRPPFEHGITDKGAIGNDLTLEYLLLLRNSRMVPCNAAPAQINMQAPISHKPIYIDSFPKLRAWYCLNKSCIASTLSGLSNGNPIHQNADRILNMIFWKLSMSKNSSTTTNNGINGPPGGTGDDAYQVSLLPAWDVLEAIPLVLEAMLTACAHGRLSSRDLTTGLRDLVDFLPASLASIISYFSAEVTRGIWKSVAMNGTEWPSPAANLVSIESEMKHILAAAGVCLPSYSSEGVPAMLPLPMAALVSLTITFKLDRSLEYIHAVAGTALENCASGCPWPSMPIIGSLWAQKIRRWHNFIVGSCTLSVFRQDREAVAQLLRSCFTSFLGSVPSLNAEGGSSVSGLLGSTICAQGLRPGFLYLRSCRVIHNVHYVNDVIVGLVTEYACELADKWASTGNSRLRSGLASLALATIKVKELASLGASLLCVAGGLQRVQELYQETIPTWLLFTRGAVKQDHHRNGLYSCMMEGYAMAYLLVLSGSLVWSAGAEPTRWTLSRRAHSVGEHLDFVARTLDGKILLGCPPATWQAYVCCLVGLMVRLTPAWIQEVELHTLKKVANGLIGWHEFELAVLLLERGGPAAIGSIAQLLM